MTRTKSRALCACLSLMLSACAKEPPARTVDTFCLTAEKKLWSIDDTPESIRAAEIWNRTIDRRCGIPGRKTA